MISIKGKKDYLVALESVAMTDIVLNMFIFFFISFSLLYTFNSGRLSKIEVNLPKASSAVSMEGSEKTVLAITKAGEYFINEEKVKGADLKQNLRSRLEENPSLSVVLKVDGAVKFDHVVRALDVINELDIRKVSVAATGTGRRK
ncbi:MAG: biopolymer transporter ExbD [Candidatus Omnitrophota bacterium]